MVSSSVYVKGIGTIMSINSGTNMPLYVENFEESFYNLIIEAVN